MTKSYLGEFQCLLIVFHYVGSALMQNGAASIADILTFRYGSDGDGFGQLCSAIPREIQSFEFERICGMINIPPNDF